MSASGLVMSPVKVHEGALPQDSLALANFAPPPDEIQIFLSTSRHGEANPTALRVLSSETVASVKMRISRLKGLLAQQQILVCGGRELSRDTAELSDYGVRGGDLLHLAVRLTDLVDVVVKRLDGSEITIQLERGSRIYDLKQRLITQGDKEGSAQDLVLRNKAGARLSDSLLVDDAIEGADSAVTIHLLVRRSASYNVSRDGKHVELEINASSFRPPAQSRALVDRTQSLNLPRAASVEALPFKPAALQRRPSVVIETCAEPDVGSPLQDSQPLGVHGWVDLSCGVSLEPALGLEKDLPGNVQKLVQEARAGLEAGYAPSLSLSGMGGTYFFQDQEGVKTVAVFKPVDEEPLAKNNPRGLTPSETGEGLKTGIRVGTGAYREVAAYLLDHGGFASVPPTTLALVRHDSFNLGDDEDSMEPKLGSLQQFVESQSNCEEMGTGIFPVEEVHKLSVLDCRLANLDRNGDNVLVQQAESGLRLVPIDHGYCIPESFQDVWFDWLYWPQARVPYNNQVKEYIEKLDVEEDLAILERNGIPLTPACVRVLRVSTMLLQKAVKLGMTAYMIGSIMCRESLNEESPLERMLELAEEAVLPGYSEGAFLEAIAAVLDELLPIYRQQIA